MFMMSDAKAQDSLSNSIYFLAGANYSLFRGNDLIKDVFEPSITYTNSLGYKRAFTHGLSARMQVQQLVQGMQDEITWTNETGAVISKSPFLMRMEYVSLSALLEKSFGSRKYFRVFAGGYGAYNYRSYSLMQSGEFIPGSYLDFTSSTEKTDIGIAAGIGFSYPVAKTIRINLDFTNMLGITNALRLENTTRKFNSTNAMLGFEFLF